MVIAYHLDGLRLLKLAAVLITYGLFVRRMSELFSLRDCDDILVAGFCFGYRKKILFASCLKLWSFDVVEEWKMEVEVQGKLPQVKSRLQAASAFTAQPLLSQAGGRAVVTGRRRRRRRYVPQTDAKYLGSGVSARLPGVPSLVMVMVITGDCCIM